MNLGTLQKAVLLVLDGDKGKGAAHSSVGRGALGSLKWEVDVFLLKTSWLGLRDAGILYGVTG